MIFAIDVDLTFFPSDRYWWDFMFFQMKRFPEVFPTDIPTSRLLSYDLTDEIRDIGYPNVSQIDSYSFWKGEGIYDDMEPLPYAVDALRVLYNEGHEVLFVSAIKGNHHKSKYYALKKHVPFMSGLIATKEKHYTFCDYIIDDRVSNLALFDKRGFNRKQKILFTTPYKQDVENYSDYTQVSGWSDFIAKYGRGELCL